MDRQQVSVALADVALTSREMQHVFQLKTQSGTGTCFLYGTKDGFFYVTARHLIEKSMVGDSVYFGHSNEWQKWMVTAIFLPNDAHDIAVFVTDCVWKGNPDFESDFAVLPGQPVKFLGFPHGLNSDYPSSNGYLTPLVRSANFSGVIQKDNITINVLDGFNNPGYSGGPVYCCGDDGKAKFFGVVSGYRYETESHSLLYKKNSSGEFEPLPDYMVKLNSGMIYVTGKSACNELFTRVDQFQPRQPAP